MKSFLKEKYNKEISASIKQKLGVKNVMAVPRVMKVSINSGIGKYLKEKDAVDEIVANLRTITGQKPMLAKAKKSISGFKVREGQEVGVAVTIRGIRMWHFIERLVYSAFPRVRDFRGIDEKNIDKQGNLNVAIKEQIIFPEISAENVKNIFSFQVNIATSAKTKEEGLELFKQLGFPLTSNNE